MTRRVAIIAAVAKNGVIGAGGAMPWRLSSDLRRFKALTMGKPIIMGRKTFESIGKPLPGRDNIVISRQSDFAPDGVLVAPDLDAALAAASEPGRPARDDEIMVIGGGEIYRAALSLADRLYITHVEATPQGDTYFPKIEGEVWRGREIERVPAGEKDSAASRLVVYERLAASGASR